VQFPHLAFEHVHEQLHQSADLVLGPAPVLAGEREQGQRPDPALEAEIDAGRDRARPGAMADDPGPAAAFGPAPVAVHDHGEVLGNAHRSTTPKGGRERNR
jgi:hypothetical protein